MKKLFILALSLAFATASSYAETDCLLLVAEKNVGGHTAVHSFNYGVNVKNDKVFLRIYGGATVTPGQASWQFVNFALTGFYDVKRTIESNVYAIKNNAKLIINLEDGMKDRSIINHLSQEIGDLNRFIRKDLQGKDKERFSGYVLGVNPHNNSDLTGVFYCKTPKEKSEK